MKLRLVRRSIKHLYQKLTRGFSDQDLWSLDHIIAEFVLPRLRRFRDIDGCYPGCEGMETEEQWNAALDDMIFALQLIVAEWTDPEPSPEDRDRCQRGLELFGKWFQALWW